MLLALGLPSVAQGATPLGPPDGATTSSRPTLFWDLAPNEQAEFLELSPNPAPGSFGGFTDDSRKRTEPLTSGQRSFVVGNASRLDAGAWYWHVSGTLLPEYQFGWSAVRRFRVRDEAIRVRRWTIQTFSCLREFLLSIDYVDNTRVQRARWWVDIRRRTRGRLITRLRGRATDGSVSAGRRISRRLRRGRYVARLFVRDGARHVTRTKFRRIRIGRCG